MVKQEENLAAITAAEQDLKKLDDLIESNAPVRHKAFYVNKAEVLKQNLQAIKLKAEADSTPAYDIRYSLETRVTAGLTRAIRDLEGQAK